MARFITAPDSRYPAQAHHMLQFFGVKGSKWPARGCPARCIQGIWVQVLPVDHVSLVDPTTGKKRRRAQHRVIASCPECGARVSAGRLQQHRCDAHVTRAEAQRRTEFKQTLERTRAAAADAQRRFDQEACESGNQ